MATRSDVMDWVVKSLNRRGGAAHHIQIAKDIWDLHEAELRASGDLFYTWRYDLRWAGRELRSQGTLRPDTETRRGVWALSTAQRL